MTLSTSLRTAARNLVNTFGNTASVYTYSSATTSESEEGDITVSDWKTAASIKVVNGDNVKESLIQAGQGMESIGEDEKIIRDDATVAVNDRITVDSVEYRVDEIRPVITQDTLVVQIIKVSRVTDTTNW